MSSNLSLAWTSNLQVCWSCYSSKEGHQPLHQGALRVQIKSSLQHSEGTCHEEVEGGFELNFQMLRTSMKLWWAVSPSFINDTSWTDHSCDLWWHSAAFQKEIAFRIQSCMFQFWRFASSRPCINFEEWQYSFHPFCQFLSISLCLWVYKRNRILHPVVHGSILNPISFCRHLGSSVKAEGIGWVIQNILLRVLNMSTSARTRKMENNACEGRSQEKLWWRFITILTCKSFVILGYRGKRTKVLDESFRILC